MAFDLWVNVGVMASDVSLLLRLALDLWVNAGVMASNVNLWLRLAFVD